VPASPEEIQEGESEGKGIWGGTTRTVNEPTQDCQLNFHRGLLGIDFIGLLPGMGLATL